MTTRFLIFDDNSHVRTMLSLFLKQQGYDVLGFDSPLSCDLLAQQSCSCPRSTACADAMVTAMNMPRMSGPELIRFQQKRGCHLPIKNIAIGSSRLREDQKDQLKTLGCSFLSKPFNFNQISTWAKSCQARVTPHRTLVPLEELWKTVVKAAFH
ncbi:MAG: response regulator [Deltaproteobacteria bacterium]|jgi:CheY-like chemotaxis protein|nr:response regulator [Deltaproteobacteria bacterium]